MPDRLTPDERLELLDRLENIIEFKFLRVITAAGAPLDSTRIEIDEFKKIGVDLLDTENPVSRKMRDYIRGFEGVNADQAEVGIPMNWSIPDKVRVTAAITNGMYGILVSDVIVGNLEEVFTPLQPYLEWDDVPTFPDPTMRGLPRSIESAPEIKKKMERYQKDIKNARRAAKREQKSAASIAGDATKKGTAEGMEDNAFYRDGGFWFIRFNDKKARFADSRGFLYLHLILSNPGKEILPSVLQRANANAESLAWLKPEVELDLKDINESFVDDRPRGQSRLAPWHLQGDARNEYDQLRGEIEEVTASVPSGGCLTEEQEKKIECLREQLKEILDKGFKGEERAANSVRNAVNRAKKKLREKGLGNLADHLDKNLSIPVLIKYPKIEEHAIVWDYLADPKASP